MNELDPQLEELLRRQLAMAGLPPGNESGVGNAGAMQPFAGAPPQPPQLPASLTQPEYPSQEELQQKINQVKAASATAPVTIGEEEFRSASPAPPPMDTNWLQSMISGAVGGHEPSRYDYGAPQRNVPDSPKYGAQRDYRNFDEIVIEDSTGPRSAGTNRTVVQATPRGDFKENMAGYEAGQFFQSNPDQMGRLLTSILGADRSKPQSGPRPAPVSVINEMSELSGQIDKAMLDRDSVHSSASDSWLPWVPDAEEQRAEADKKFQSETRPLINKRQILLSQYPSLGSERMKSSQNPEELAGRLQQTLPNIDPGLAQAIVAAYMQQGGM